MRKLGRLGRKLQKSTVRLDYESLRGLGAHEWSDEHCQYLEQDVLDAQLLFREYPERPDECLQNRAHFALQLAQCWGMITDPVAVGSLRQKIDEVIADSEQELIRLRVLRPKPKRNKHGVLYHPADMTEIRRRIRLAYKGRDIPRTPTKRIATDAETLRESGDSVLKLYAHTSTARTVRSYFLPRLTPLVHPGFQILVATGRTSGGGGSEVISTQNLPAFGGVRECFVPRPGCVFVWADFSGAELRSFAQVCLQKFGHSTFARAFQKGVDPHTFFAADILGWDFDKTSEAWARYQVAVETSAEARKLLETSDPDALKARSGRKKAKVCNFAFLGGMGEVGVSEVLGVERSEGARLRNLWFRRFPEAKAFLDSVYIGAQSPNYQVTQLYSGRVRGGLGYYDGANTHFQGLTADGSKEALWAISYECYQAPESPLFGSRLVNFVHDEYMLETPESRAELAAQRLKEIMVRSMNLATPDVPAETEPHILTRWRKL